MDFLWRVAEQFAPEGEIVDVREHGNGNINDTYLVIFGPGEGDKFVLQRINTHVFTRPERIIHNLRIFTDHADGQIDRAQDDPGRQWHIPHIRPTRSGQDYHVDSQGSFWRAISFVNHSQSFDTVLDEAHAREAGYALGRFHALVSDLDVLTMHDTLEGFHIPPRYLEVYDRARDRTPRDCTTPEVRYCREMIEARRPWASVLEDAKARGELQMRVIHGDPKINNFMISEQTGRAVSVIDLDTVKPGLVHYDIGDCLRSSCNPLGEETTDFEQVRFDVGLAEAILDGYGGVAKDFLTENDYAYLYDAIRLLPFELGLRFFSDYLAGNVYFKARYNEHNLHRAIVQFKLAESVESQEVELHAVINDLR